MGRPGVGVIDPASELRQDRLAIPELGAVYVVPLERRHKGCRESVALRAIRWRRNRQQTELVSVEHVTVGACYTLTRQPQRFSRILQRNKASQRGRQSCSDCVRQAFYDDG